MADHRDEVGLLLLLCDAISKIIQHNQEPAPRGAPVQPIDRNFECPLTNGDIHPSKTVTTFLKRPTCFIYR